MKKITKKELKKLLSNKTVKELHQICYSFIGGNDPEKVIEFILQHSEEELTQALLWNGWAFEVIKEEG